MPGKRLCLLGFFVVSLGNLQAQGFFLSSVQQGIQVYNPNAFFGSGVSFYDFNKDSLDDLTFCVMGDSVIFFQNTGTAFQRSEVIPNSSDAKHPVWVDIDNDHDADLMITKRNGGLSLYENTGAGVFQNITSQLNKPNAPGAHSYGCSWADYDKDGLLDCYVCNYNWNDGISNWLFHNLGDGNFEEVGSLAAVSNDSRPSFQSVWIDYDFDNWPDLFVVNDKLTGNTLYRNLGNGSFQDVSLSTGAYQTMCAMSAGVTDFERDGDWDIYISNFIFDNSFLKFQDGSFENIAQETGLEVNAMCWGSLWIDYDNDSDEDLHVSTTSPTINNNQNHFYNNNGDGSFTFTLGAGFVNDDFNSYSSAKGDWNRDGFPDMVITNTLNNTASLYTNSAVGGNSVTIGLEGVVSNADAIGSLIEVFAGDLHLMQYTMCGENYMGQDSQYEMFGIGELTVVDSVVISWPSGFSETHYGLNANQLHIFTEGQTLQSSVSSETGFAICGTDTITLDAGAWSQYAWSNGHTTQTIEVSDPGVYSVVIWNEFGLSDTAMVVITSVPEPEWVMTMLTPTCFGFQNGEAIVELTNSEVQMVLWNDGNTELHRDSLAAGDYIVGIWTANGCYASDTVSIAQPEILEAWAEIAHVTCHGANDGVIAISTSGGTGNTLVNWGETDPEACAPGQYEFIISDENGCEALVPVEITEPPAIIVENSTIESACSGSTGSALIEASGGTGALEFDWQGLDPEELPPGEHVVIISDETGCQLNFSITLTEYPAIIAEFDLIHPENGSDGSIGIYISGGVPPYEVAWSNGQESFFINNLSPGTYTCFVSDNAGCSEVFEVTLIDVSIYEPDSDHERFTIIFNEFLEFPAGTSGVVSIHDIAGRLVHRVCVEGKTTIDTSGWPYGYYFTDSGTRLVKIAR